MIKRYDFKGKPGEIGVQHGETLKDEIESLYSKLMQVYTANEPTSNESSIIGAASRHIDMTKKYAPDLIEEIDGIAAGAGLPFEKVFFMNCYDELSHYKNRKEQVNGCTSFLACGLATADNRTYLGQGWDMSEFFKPVIISINSMAYFGEKPKSIFLTHPGIVGGAGINEYGLALIWNTVKALDEKPGVPVTLLIRKVLDGKNLNDALKTLLNTPRASGFNYMVGNEYGGFNIEATGTREQITYVTAIHSHANHYEDEVLRLDENKPPDKKANSYIRSGRMRQLLENYFGKIDLDICKNILCDHANYPLGICRHLVEGETDSLTQSALIFIPEEKLMLASDGPPCNAGYEIYSL